MRRKIAAGNWKMNGTRADLDELQTLTQTHGETSGSVVLCPPLLCYSLPVKSPKTVESKLALKTAIRPYPVLIQVTSPPQ